MLGAPHKSDFYQWMSDIEDHLNEKIVGNLSKYLEPRPEVPGNDWK